MEVLQRSLQTLFYLSIAGYAVLALFLIINAILRTVKAAKSASSDHDRHWKD